MTFCPPWSLLHRAWNAGMILPYTSRGVLYAANVIVGDFGGMQPLPPAPCEALLEQATPAASPTATTAAVIGWLLFTWTTPPPVISNPRGSARETLPKLGEVRRRPGTCQVLHG